MQASSEVHVEGSEVVVESDHLKDDDDDDEKKGHGSESDSDSFFEDDDDDESSTPSHLGHLHAFIPCHSFSSL